ncbi:MAG TPA: helix-turn-helix transcriptional regulator [Acidimicrobiales bacterium]|nr:helix-turn-helix transcriptional regulator [Acidimicrobiales bacterium]
MAVQREQLGWWPRLTFGQRLRMIRHEYGNREGRVMTQREMAARLGCPEGNYAAWEADNGVPRDTVGMAKRVGELTGADPLWLMGWFDDDPDNGPPEPDDRRPPPVTSRYPLPAGRLILGVAA